LSERRIPKLEADMPEVGSLNKPRFSLVHRVHPMTRRDLAVLVMITAVYAAVAFWGLGNKNSPQSFLKFEETDNVITLTLKEARPIGKIMYFTGLHTGEYKLRYSEDGKQWSDTVTFKQEYENLFSWLNIEIYTEKRVKYIELWAQDSPLELGELGIYNETGKLEAAGDISYSSSKASKLFDEQSTVPLNTNYLNSMYFDEIYHGRTAYEHIENVYPYEVSHPPLGKLIIALGIKLFGMTPFGWRFMGTLFGILMLPFMFVFIKNFFGKTLIAACGTLLFAFDFMHFVQTRIATIDTYSVFFILLMFFFMYRYVAQDYKTSFQKTLVPLFFSGLCFALGAASKWTVIYGGAGLALLWLLRQIMRGRYSAANGQSSEFISYLVKTVLFSLMAFIALPGIIYILSYIPYGTAKGMTLSGGMLWSKEFYEIIIENQKFMFGYHSKLVATHPYSSPWFSWLLNIRPILYYLEYLPNDYKSAFGAFGNPVLWWGGFIALIYTFIRFFKNRDSRALFIIIGYLSQILPWVGISRIVFIYHYFPSTLFLVLATCYAFNCIYEKGKGRYKLGIMGYTAVSTALFAAFYPVLTGVPAPSWYTTNFLQWIPSAWPF
jgi:predicted membrane-bound dolichyl-phosphate-mannose-protein mannosyltransferase